VQDAAWASLVGALAALEYVGRHAVIGPQAGSSKERRHRCAPAEASAGPLPA
jgi:hypothetical protein